MSNDYHHLKVVQALRALNPEGNPITAWVNTVSDDDIIRHMFSNARIDGKDIRGGRLNHTGAKILKTIFTHWEVEIEHPLTSRQQLRFARACKLPYYFSNRILLTFDKEVGVWLALIRGNIDLMDDVLPE